MAALHSALQALGPAEFSSVPVDDLKPYLLDIFSKCDTLVESVPDPPSETTPSARSRAATVSSIASNASEMSSSSARSAPPSPEHATLQKEWGKAIKLGAKENPLGMSVYKLSAKDGRGSWFARRSVHEGLGFSKWKRALQREFPQSMEVQGGPGEGNVRGIGGEKRVEKKVVPGVGTMEVYHLSAQFPGPTAPRDFVTLLLTSSNALRSSTTSATSTTSQAETGASHVPRHFIVVSKPCEHPDCAPREGYVRGHYESIECIREIPLYAAPVRRSASALDLSTVGRAAANTSSLGKEAALRSAAKSHTFPAQLDYPEEAPSNDDGTRPATAATDSGSEAPTGRRRGKTISFVEPPGPKRQPGSGGAQDDSSVAQLDWERNPVEWIMMTRSDPGGSVPRWMVERGTPAGIVGDAVKFLNWATTLEDLPEQDGAMDGDVRRPSLTGRTFSDDLQALDLNAHLVGIDGVTSKDHASAKSNGANAAAATSGRGNPVNDAAAWRPDDEPREREVEPSTALGADAVRPAVDATSTAGTAEREDSIGDDDDVSSLESFATASSKSHETDLEADDVEASTNNDARSSHTTASATPGDGARGPVDASAIDHKEISRLTERKRKLDEKLAATKSKILGTVSSPAQLSPKRSATLAKAEERHRKETEKHEQKYRNHVQKLETKRERERVKEEERRRKQDAKGERSRLAKEKDDLRHRVETLTTDNEALTTQLGELQRQNTLLAARLGKIDAHALQEVVGSAKASAVTTATPLDETNSAVAHASGPSAKTDGAPPSS